MSIKIQERKFFWLITLIAILLSLWPHLIGWQKETNENFTSYQAYNTFVSADTNIYYSYINQASNGAWLFENLFTSEAQEPSLFHPLWLVGGWLKNLTTLSTPMTFHLMRALASIFFLWIVYRFLIWLGLDKDRRRWAFVIVVFGSGLGAWLTPWPELLNYKSFYSTDIAMAEANTFTTIYHSPLFPLSQALIVLIFQTFITAFRKVSKKLLLGTGMLVFAVALMHTYDLITIAVVLVMYVIFMLLRDQLSSPAELLRYFKYGLIILLFSLPAIIYFLIVIQNQPAIAGWIEQNITKSPSVWAYLLGYGLLLPLAVIGAGKIINKESRTKILLIIWSLTSAVLIYFPFLQIQRRLTNSLHIPIAILAGIGLAYLWKKVGTKIAWLKIVIIPIIAVILFATPVAIVIRDSLYVAEQNAQDHLYFITLSENEAFNFLKTQAGNKEVIYAHPQTGNVLGGRGFRVFIGHGHQTVNWDIKREQIDNFFQVWPEKDRETYFRDNAIKWLYYGPEEQKLGSWTPESSTWLELTWQQPGIGIYHLRVD
ncbi:hypothetical protein ACFL04_00070 [Patescibacteria group bacterium]